MKLSDYFVEKRVVASALALLLLVGGYYSYTRLSRFEDPEFIIRQAMIITPYPGARPSEVAEEVTDLVETAAQEMQEVKEINSVSVAGRSEVRVEIKMEFSRTKEELQGAWGKLRNKIKDAEKKLPPGAGPIMVNDDFGDVYGLFYAITGDGYSYSEIRDYADTLRRELLLVPGVAKVAYLGDQKEAIFIEIARERMVQLGITPDTIFSMLEKQNMIGPAGAVRVGPELIQIAPKGHINSVEDMANLKITGSETGRQILLRDVAQIKREFIDPPSCLLRYGGKPAIGLGISNVSGGNVVQTAQAVAEKLMTLEALRPVGMEINTISNQGDSVKLAIGGFMVNLVEAVIIVVVTLLIFMGARAGIIMGLVLLLTVAGTLVIMHIESIAMQRISLGALIIALGMLVDNAIVVTEGILIRLRNGSDGKSAARQIVGQTIWPLFGGTIVGILAFSAIGFSPDSTGEYAGSLFWVICYSLLLSWLFAITFTPFLCVSLLRPGKSGGKSDNPHGGRFFRIYSALLKVLIRRRWTTLATMLVLLLLSVYGFGFVPTGFFPEATTKQFVVDYWRSEGTDIRTISEDLSVIEKWVSALEGVTNVTTIIGQGALRFMLTYGPESPNTSYGQLLVDVDDYRTIPGLLKTIQERLDREHPDAQAKAWKFILGPGGGSKIQAAFRGPDPAVLRKLSEKAKDVFFSHPDAIAVKDDWRERTKVVRPVFSEEQARRAGIMLPQFRNALQTTFSGSQVGLFRENEKMLPIISRAPLGERVSMTDMSEIQVFSPTASAYVPLIQLVSEIRTDFEDPIIRRKDRFPTITAMCDPRGGIFTSSLFADVRRDIEAIPLPPGYQMKWEGEYGDSQEAQKGLASMLPLGLVAMLFTVLMLFNGLRQLCIIWLAVPLAIIGVTLGLLVFQAPFEFMAILGFLSLIGMLIKNAIVLVDQIDYEIGGGKERFQAVIESSASRVLPVSMGALTTALGMMPLLADPFFKSMAVTIIFGLSFATALTLLIVPVLYATFFGISEKA